MSNKSRDLKKKYLTCKVLSLLLIFLPVAIFMIIAFANGTTTQKVGLGLGVTLSIFFAIANAMFKLAPRSTVWILIITLTIAVQKIQSVIYVTGACVILEECITSKLEKYYHDKYKINKEIDERFDIKEKEVTNGEE